MHTFTLANFQAMNIIYLRNMCVGLAELAD